MNKWLGYPAMLGEAKVNGKGKGWFMETLIFLLVFTVASTVQAIPQTIATYVNIFTNPESMEAINEAADALTRNLDYDAYMEAIISVLNNMPTWMAVFSLFTTVLLTVVVILFCKLLQKRKLPSLGFRRKHAVREYLVGALIGIGMIAASWGLCILTGAASFSVTTFSIPMVILYFFGYLFQGMSEEVLVRGYFMPSIARKNSVLSAVLISSFLFACMHLLNPGISFLAFINLFLSGITFSVYVLKRGNIWGACAMHSLWNFFQGNIFGVSVSGTGIAPSVLQTTLKEGTAWTIWNGGSFGLEGGLMVTVVEVSVILILLFLVPAKHEEMPMNGYDYGNAQKPSAGEFQF